jgi:hypothetical protein
MGRGALPCSVDGCTRPTRAKGLCAPHGAVLLDTSPVVG